MCHAAIGELRILRVSLRVHFLTCDSVPDGSSHFLYQMQRSNCEFPEDLIILSTVSWGGWPFSSSVPTKQKLEKGSIRFMYIKRKSISYPWLCLITQHNRVMGSFNSCSCSGSRGRRSKLKRTLFQTMNTQLASHHQGIKTVAVEQLCKFSSKSSLCMNIVTWNMNGKVSYQDLAELVGVDRKFDLLVIGLQEVPRCNIRQLLQEALVETHSLLGRAIMQSLQLFVFGPKNSSHFIKEIKVDKHALGGFGGLIRRKKGAVALSISFKGIRMVFISCHLSAHASNVEVRNSQCRHISHSLFSKNQNPYARPSHITVWLGDLNYRIHGIDTLPARNLIQKDLQRLLTSNDQLLQEAERGQVFSGYCEGTLAFKPTYKYNIGSSNYDTSYKVRVPSWTDRILYKIEKFANIEATLHSYESIDGIYSSDHKPVKAHLCLKVNKRQSITPH